MEASNEPNLPKILISIEEFNRLKHIEKKYLEKQTNSHFLESEDSQVGGSNPAASNLFQEGFGEEFSKKIAHDVLQKVWEHLPINQRKN